MGKLTKDLREGKLQNPCSHKFKYEKWNNTLKNYTLDNEDRKTIIAVEFVRDKHATIRECIEKYIPKCISKNDAILGMIGTANRSNFVITETVQSKLNQNKIINFNTIAAGNQIQLLGNYNEATPDQISQTVASSIKYPLMYANKMLPEKSTTNDEEYLKAIKLHDNFSILHNYVNEIWNGVLFGTVNLYKFDKIYFAHPTVMKHDLVYHAGLLRSKSRAANALVHFHKEKYSTEFLAHPVLTVKNSGKKKTISTRNSTESENIALASLLLSVDSFYDNILDDKLPNLKNLSLRQLYNALSQLQGLKLDIYKRHGKEKGVLHKKTLKEYAQQFNGNQIVKCFKEISGISGDQAIRILDLFTYNIDNWEEDMMTKPLIKYKDKYLPFFPAFSPDPTFITSYWLKVGGYPLEKRGKLFESELRQELSNIPEEFKLTTNAEAIIFKANCSEEEIDLAMLFDETLYICELKCSFPAYCDHDRHITYNKLINACLQCERKEKLVNENLQDFCHRYFNGKAVSNISTLVITNDYTFSSCKFGNTIVVDKYTLINFFDGPEFITIGAEDISHEYIPYDLLSYYPTPEVASKYFANYLHSPPQISYQERNIHLSKTYFPPLTRQDKPIIKYSYNTR